MDKELEDIFKEFFGNNPGIFKQYPEFKGKIMAWAKEKATKCLPDFSEPFPSELMSYIVEIKKNINKLFGG